MTLEQALRWKWEHVDFGKVQVCAKFMGVHGYKHGDIVEGESNLTLAKQGGLKFSEEPIKYKGVFRLIEKDLYTDEFMREALPLLKRWHEQQL